MPIFSTIVISFSSLIENPVKRHFCDVAVVVAAHKNQKGINKGSPYFIKSMCTNFQQNLSLPSIPNRKSVKNGVLAPLQR